MSAKVMAALRDARTIYDIACIREQSTASTREDADFRALALRNYQFCDAMAELIARGNRIEQRNRGAIWGDEDAVAQDWAEFRAALTRVQGGGK